MREDSCQYKMPLLCAEWLSRSLFMVGGGGGTAATGIHNKVLLARFEDGVVSDPLAETALGTQTPIRSSKHPNGKDVVLGMMDRGIKHLRLDVQKTTPALVDLTASPVLDAFEGIEEEVVCLKFSPDGQWIAAGFTRGWIQIWQWPEMHVKSHIRKDAVFPTLKDMDICYGVKTPFLVLSTEKGTAEVWDCEKGTCLHELPKPRDRMQRYVYCRFLSAEESPVLFTTIITKKGSHVWKWELLDSSTFQFMRKVKIGSEVISAFAVTRRALISGTSEGNILVHSTSRMLPMQYIEGAHKWFVSSVVLSPVPDNQDPSEMLSISGDASAKVTSIVYKGETVLWLKSMTPYLIINLILFFLAILILIGTDSGDMKLSSGGGEL